MLNRFLGGHDGKRLGWGRPFGLLDFGDQDVTVLNGINPMAWVLDCLDVPCDAAAILGSSPWLEWSRQ